jgi:hypothetical protein
MPPKSSGRAWIFCPDCKNRIDPRSKNALKNHLNKYCSDNVLNQLKSSSSSSSSSSLVMDMEYESAHSQANQFSFSSVLDSRGMEIVPINEEETRPFEDYLEQEIFNDNPDAPPNIMHFGISDE